MSKDEVIEKLKKLKQDKPDISWSGIERRIKMPKNNLVGMINGTRVMPQKWIDALEEFLKRFDGDILDNRLIDILNSEDNKEMKAAALESFFNFGVLIWKNEGNKIRMIDPSSEEGQEIINKKSSTKPPEAQKSNEKGNEGETMGAEGKPEIGLGLTDEQKKAHNEELKRMIKEVEARKCPIYMNFPKFEAAKEKEILSIKKQLI